LKSIQNGLKLFPIAKSFGEYFALTMDPSEIPSECKHGYGEYKIRETHKYFDKQIDDLKRINNLLRLASCDGCKFFEMKGCCHILHNPYGEQPEINEENFQGYREYIAEVVHQSKKLIVRIDKEFEVRNEEYKDMKEKLRKYKKKSKTRKEKVIVRKEEKCVYRRWVYLQQARFSSQFAKAALILMAENVKNLKYENGRNFCEECDKESKGIQEYEIVLTTLQLDDDMNLLSRKKNSLRVDTGPTTDFHCRGDLLNKLMYVLLHNANASHESETKDETEETAEDVKDIVDNFTNENDNEVTVDSDDVTENGVDVCKDVIKTSNNNGILTAGVTLPGEELVRPRYALFFGNVLDYLRSRVSPESATEDDAVKTAEDVDEIAVDSVDITENINDVCKDANKTSNKALLTVEDFSKSVNDTAHDTAAIVNAAINLAITAHKPTFNIEDAISDSSVTRDDTETILNADKILDDATDITNDSTTTDTIETGAETSSDDGGSSSVNVESPCAPCAPCARDSCPNPGVFLCSMCRMVAYCGKECSKVCWPGHKEQCRKEAKRREKRKQKKQCATEVD